MAPLVFLVACVPATEDGEPKGGIAAVMVPSPASRGEAFVTSDGWTVRIDPLLVEYVFIAEKGEGSLWLFHASESIEALVRGVPAGPATLSVELTVGYGFFTSGPTINKGATVTARDEQRMTRPYVFECPTDPAESSTEPERLTNMRAEIYLSAWAERNGHAITLETPIKGLLRPENSSSGQFASIVRADAFTRVEIGVHAERLFMGPTGSLGFDDFAASDRDGDGRVTPSELCFTSSPNGGKRMFTVLGERAMTLLGER